MKIRLDENVSHRVAGAIRAITANRPGFEVSWVGEAGPDPDWLRRFAEEDGTAIVSGDYNILQRWPNLVAYAESELIAFFPPTPYKRLKGFARAALWLRWWPAIVEKIKLSSPGDTWRLPMSWTPDINGFKQIKDPRISAEREKDTIKQARKVVPLRRSD